MDQKVVLQLDVDEESKTVDVRLRLDQNYRKTKGIIEEKLKGLHWVSKVNVTLAPKVLTLQTPLVLMLSSSFPLFSLFSDHQLFISANQGWAALSIYLQMSFEFPES